jgi:hypothetical protein
MTTTPPGPCGPPWPCATSSRRPRPPSATCPCTCASVWTPARSRPAPGRATCGSPARRCTPRPGSSRRPCPTRSSCRPGPCAPPGRWPRSARPPCSRSAASASRSRWWRCSGCHRPSRPPTRWSAARPICHGWSAPSTTPPTTTGWSCWSAMPGSASRPWPGRPRPRSATGSMSCGDAACPTGRACPSGRCGRCWPPPEWPPPSRRGCWPPPSASWSPGPGPTRGPPRPPPRPCAGWPASTRTSPARRPRPARAAPASWPRP